MSEPWTNKETKLLGTAPDHMVAAALGRTRAAVICKRRKLGIPAFQSAGRPKTLPVKVRITVAGLGAFGSVGEAEAARREHLKKRK